MTFAILIRAGGRPNLQSKLNEIGTALIFDKNLMENQATGAKRRRQIPPPAFFSWDGEPEAKVVKTERNVESAGLSTSTS